MKITYFDDTDTLLVEFAETEIEETKDLDDYTLGDFDREGHLVALTLEHASKRADLRTLNYANAPIVLAS
jgi:uncharacterized protein YuzE